MAPKTLSNTDAAKPHFIGSPSFFIYINYILGSWGDWMWQFAVGLYLVFLNRNKLLLAAVYGFTGGSCVLILGGVIGDWVDKNGRLKVMLTSLVIQNLSVAFSAIAVALTLQYGEKIDDASWSGMRTLCEAVIIILAILAQLGSVAYKIAIEKDWIVVIAEGKKSQLANLNAVTRAIDLCFKVLAPTTVGLIMTYVSKVAAAVVIAGWNLVSVVLEFGLLYKVYHMVPALAVKHAGVVEMVEDSEVADVDNVLPTLEGVQMEDAVVQPPSNPTASGDKDRQNEGGPESKGLLSAEIQEKAKTKEDKSLCQTLLQPIVSLVNAWRTYARQKVVFAGLSLAFLYMTVLGFDSITTGYIYTNNIPEWAVGVSMALAGVTGLIGTYAFTVFRRYLGLERTGLLAYSAEILCLTLCIASIFLPGTLFHPQWFQLPFSNNCTTPHTTPHSNASSVWITTPAYNHSVHRRSVWDYNMESCQAPVQFSQMGQGQILGVNPYWMAGPQGEELGADQYWREVEELGVERVRRAVDQNETTLGTVESVEECVSSKISIIFFLVGIITSRVGLWMADLVVNQLLQENVAEQERGVVNGVQNSLNMLMDMLKFLLVILVPSIYTFGYLIMASFTFICLAGCLFAVHSRRVRGHLWHCHYIFPCCCTRGEPLTDSETKDLSRGGIEGKVIAVVEV